LVSATSVWPSLTLHPPSLYATAAVVENPRVPLRDSEKEKCETKRKPMKRPGVLSLLVAALLVLGVCFAVRPRSTGTAFNPGGANFPIPPGQSKPWTAPQTTLPPVVVSAITELFNDGMADPRGCEYREIEIAYSPTWKDKVHGWVLPGTGKQRYAIGWNGVIYPVDSVDEPVDLRKEYSRGFGQFRGNNNGWPMSERASLLPQLPLPIQTAILLRLGQVDLAESVWNAGYAGEDEMKVKDPYADMASVWLGRWYDRAADSYLSGDYTSAFSICQTLMPVIEKVKATAAARGIPDQGPAARYGDHLWQLPVLDADAQRRMNVQPYTPVLESGEPARGPERIAALIRDLELVSVQQITIPGSTMVIDSPTVQALINEGYPAVEPLLKCLVNDNRLTRSRYTEGMGSEGPIIPVYEAAYVALFRILNVSFPLFDHAAGDPRDLTFDDRNALAAKIQAVWRRTGGLTLPESGYVTLRDDNAGAQAWLRAVDNITQPADGTVTSNRLINPPISAFPIPGGTARFINQPISPFPIRQGAAPVVALGESLRDKSDPSVSDLIIKRFYQLLAQAASDKVISPVPIGKLILVLADWDGKAHLGDLRDMAQAFQARFPFDENAFMSTDYIARI